MDMASHFCHSGPIVGPNELRAASSSTPAVAPVPYDQTSWEEQCRSAFSSVLENVSDNPGHEPAATCKLQLDKAEALLACYSRAKGALMYGYPSHAGSDPDEYNKKVVKQMFDFAHELRKEYHWPRQLRKSTVRSVSSAQPSLRDAQQLAHGPSTTQGTTDTALRSTQAPSSATSDRRTGTGTPAPFRKTASQTKQSASRPASSRSHVSAPVSDADGRNRVDIFYDLHCRLQESDARLACHTRLRVHDIKGEWARLLDAASKLHAEDDVNMWVKGDAAKHYLKHFERAAKYHVAHCEHQMNAAVTSYKGEGIRTLQAVDKHLKWLDGQRRDLERELRPPRCLTGSKSWPRILALRNQLQAALRTAYTAARQDLETEWRTLHMHSKKRGLWKITSENQRANHSLRAFDRYDDQQRQRAREERNRRRERQSMHGRINGTRDSPKGGGRDTAIVHSFVSGLLVAVGPHSRFSSVRKLHG